jgi:hypothetical protein
VCLQPIPETNSADTDGLDTAMMDGVSGIVIPIGVKHCW